MNVQEDAGGGYELALACDEIVLVDDGNSAVSLPETALLGVLPGTGGLTRVVDKRKVRRDLADFFSTMAEGVKGRKAVQWGFVDAVYPTSKFREAVAARAVELAAGSDRPDDATGIVLEPLDPTVSPNRIDYRHVSVVFKPEQRVVELVVRGPAEDEPRTPDAIHAAGSLYWALAAFRELDDALLRLRLNEPELGTVLIRTDGDGKDVLAVDEVLLAHQDHWLVREIVLLIKRTLKRLDMTARSLFTIIEPGSCFGGHALRTGAHRRPVVHAGRCGAAECRLAVGHERRHAAHGERALAAPDSISCRSRPRLGSAAPSISS